METESRTEVMLKKKIQIDSKGINMFVATFLFCFLQIIGLILYQELLFVILVKS